MLSHAEIYANVIKARPECAVARNEFVGYKLGWGTEPPFGPQWLDDRGKYASLQSEQDAIALINDHWTEMLPAKHGIVLRPLGEWCVFGPDEDGDEAYIPWPANQPQSRFHALAEFYAPGSTKE